MYLLLCFPFYFFFISCDVVVLYACDCCDCSCIDKSMQIVLEQGSVDKPLTFHIGLLQLIFHTTVNSPNNEHFSTRPTVRYSGYVLYW